MTGKKTTGKKATGKIGAMSGAPTSGVSKSGRPATEPATTTARAGKAGAGDPAQVSVVDMAVDRIRQKIMRGQFAPGQRLIEPDLAEQINVSRTALREAFRRLAAEGLLELALYKGATVRLLGKKDVLESFLIREMLEGLVARLATPVIAGDAKLKKAMLEIRDLMRETVTSPDGSDAYTQANAQFHKFLIDAAGSAQLDRLVAQMQLPLYRIVYVRLLAESTRLRSLEEHERIIDAILAGDADAAERAMRAHVHASGESLLTLPDDYFS